VCHTAGGNAIQLVDTSDLSEDEDALTRALPAGTSSSVRLAVVRLADPDGMVLLRTFPSPAAAIRYARQAVGPDRYAAVLRPGTVDGVLMTWRYDEAQDRKDSRNPGGVEAGPPSRKAV